MRLWNLAFLLGLAGCTSLPPPACPPCPPVPAPTAKTDSGRFLPARWEELAGWPEEDHAEVLALFQAQCAAIGARALWRAVCAAAPSVPTPGAADDVAAKTVDVPSKVGAGETARAWFETHFQPWRLVAADGRGTALITGYYEPVLRGSRKRAPPYLTPVFGPPADLIVVELAELYPELKSLRLRGRLVGRRLVPYYSRAEWAREEERRAAEALLWVEDPVELFFMQVQGSGQVVLEDGSRIRLGYADQNGHPYRSIGKWLIDQGELTAAEVSLQSIKAWAAQHPERRQALLEANPSLVFFRELPVDGRGPPGALGVPLTAGRSLALDPRIAPLGAPVWLETTRPDDGQPLRRLMLMQDTGGAIKGPLRADFFWGGGETAGALAGRMKQPGQLWVLWPRGYDPPQ